MASTETLPPAAAPAAPGMPEAEVLLARPRPVARGIRTFLYAATGLAFFAGAQLSLLSEQTDRYGFWPIKVPSTAAFMGASYWATCALFLWAARQREWIRVRAAVSGGVFVTTGLLVATLDHLDQFHDRVLGVVWVEAYVIAVPAFFVVEVLQLGTPGRDRGVEQPLPPLLRWTLAAQAALMLGFGVWLFAKSSDPSGNVWAWDLTPLTAEVVAAWLLGIGGSAAYIAWRGDRADMPGPALSYIVLGGLWLIGAARFGGDLHTVGGVLYVVFAASVLAVGCVGSYLAWREGRFMPVRPPGGVPVELREG